MNHLPRMLGQSPLDWNPSTWDGSTAERVIGAASPLVSLFMEGEPPPPPPPPAEIPGVLKLALLVGVGYLAYTVLGGKKSGSKRKRSSRKRTTSRRRRRRRR